MNIYCIVNNFLILNLGISYLIFFQSQPKFYKYFFLKSKKKKEKNLK